MVTATLTEMTRVAAENTSRALSQLLNQEVSIEFQKVGIKKVKDLCPLLAPEEIVSTVLMRVSGDAEGAAMLVFPKETAFAMMNFLIGSQEDAQRHLTEMGESALKEVGNIITGAYLTVVSNAVGAKLIEHVPDLASDMFGAIMSQVIARFAREAEDVFVVEVEFAFPPKRLKGYFLLLFSKADSDKVFGAMKDA
jgi:chemotaxis protein CheC